MKLSQRTATRYRADRAIRRIIAQRDTRLSTIHQPQSNFHDVVKTAQTGLLCTMKNSTPKKTWAYGTL